jgi:hypothetical protein
MGPYLPPEILQTIFRKLGFGDLLRCKQVSKDWAFAISGSDPVLNHRLFASSTRVVKSRPSKMPLLSLRPIVHMFIVPEEGDLPSLGYDIVLHWEIKARNLPKQRSDHPIIADFPDHMSLVNKHFDYTDPWDNREQVLFRDFTTLARYLSEDPKDYGSWMGQLMCIPAVDQLDIRLLWHKPSTPETSTVERVLRTSKMENGVTVGEVVRTVRKMMKHAVVDIKKFSQELEINVCDRCNEYWDEWGDERYGDQDSDSDETDDDSDDPDDTDEEDPSINGHGDNDNDNGGNDHGKDAAAADDYDDDGGDGH